MSPRNDLIMNKTIVFLVFLLLSANIQSKTLIHKSLSRTNSKSNSKLKSTSTSKLKFDIETIQEQIQTLEAPLLTQLGDVSNWTFCSNQNQLCDFPGQGKKIVAYGIEDRFFFKEATHAVDCNNVRFGDPYPGKSKKCYYFDTQHFGSVVPTQLGSHALWTFCSNQNQLCDFPSQGKTMIAYGIEDRFFFKEATHAVDCNNGRFGDPYPGKSKKCYYFNAEYSWVECAHQNDPHDNRCLFYGQVALIKIGVNDKYGYKTLNNWAYCNNETFGEEDPEPSANNKTCWIMKPDWIECALEHGTCHIHDGQKLIRYGHGDKWNYIVSSNHTGCNNDNFGDPIKVNKKCYIYNGEYTWIPCAKEGEKCRIPGADTIVRYGAQGTYVGVNFDGDEVDCNNDVFGDPIKVNKFCHYLLAVTMDENADLKEIEDVMPNTKSAEEQEEEENRVNSGTTCSAGDGGFGYNGSCYTTQISRALQGQMSDDSKKNSDTLLRLVEAANLPVEACLGDFTPAQMKDTSAMVASKCYVFPFNDQHKYGIIGGTLKSLPCGPAPEEVAMCMGYDRCGTFVMSINGGALACAATYSTGIAAVLQPFAGTIDYVSFGFSRKRKFVCKDFSIAHKSGDKVKFSTISTRGHLFMGIALNFPLKKFKIGNKFTLDQLISIQAIGEMYVDFGNFNVANLFNQITNANSSSAENLFNEIISARAEFTFKMSGNLKIKLRKNTKGILPDINLEFGSLHMLVTTGGSGTTSGMPAGLYMSFEYNITSIFNAIMDNIDSVLSAVGIGKPKLPSAKTKMGLFITAEALGLSFSAGKFLDVRCMFIFSKFKLSCGIDSEFFTALIEAGKWLVKKAVKLMADAGKAVIEFADDVGEFAGNAAKATADFFKNDVADFFNGVGGAMEDLGNNVTNNMKNLGKGISKGVVKGYNQVKKWFRF